ncbi:MauE/DoxX family redox-associated membrane protein [Geobacter sp. DSM 9736]|uniref:MauE/DoxX family redox-associated membrane protein n=1 Tax=Geobacter sp. DSM 9736 TaxID=1277350 RepID=UPI000B5086B7|nr:MauE/DoxX family redox-associated membrane protein [Geobacter sp. DSM 9736]SNB48027.1 Methylamine utilisation protein MauE [Geobacter sp. DSM 9736]
MTKRTTNIIHILVRLLLGGIFIYAGIIKIIDPVAFAGNIAAYQVLPYFGNYLAAAILPWLELLCGLLLVTGYRARGAAATVALLNIVFILLLASTIVRGLDIDCGCFRQGGPKTSAWTAIMRDLLLLALALFTMYQPERSSNRFR